MSKDLKRISSTQIGSVIKMIAPGNIINVIKIKSVENGIIKGENLITGLNCTFINRQNKFYSIINNKPLIVCKAD